MAPHQLLGIRGSQSFWIVGSVGELMRFISKSVMAAIEESEVLGTRLLY